MAAARRAESDVLGGKPLGPLHGVPVSVKDLIDVQGTESHLRLSDAQGRIAPADAPSVERLREAGAIILGKTTTSEFGYRGYTKSLVHGNTRNPWNLGRTPGGSSGGAVASVAAGVSALALGTDGGGSIRAPSSLTGLVGIKANFAAFPCGPPARRRRSRMWGRLPAPSTTPPCCCRSAPAPTRVIRSRSCAHRRRTAGRAEIRRLRVAFSPTLGYARVEPPVADAVASAVDKLQAVFPNIELVEQVCADEGEILAAEFIGGCSARLGDIVDSAPDLIDPPLLAAIRAFRATTTDRFTRLLRRRLQHRETMRQFFEHYDLLLTPTTPCTAWDIERGLPPGHENAIVWSYFTYPFNLTGQPAGSLPCGLSPEGLPIGLQLVAPLGGEARLVGAMRAAEAVLGSPCPLPIEPIVPPAQD